MVKTILIRPATPQTFQETLDNINRLERDLIQQHNDTFNNLEETNYFDLIETLTVEKDGSQVSGDDDDTVEPLGYWMEDHKAELDSRDH